MSKNEGSSDSNGCLILVFIFLMCLYTCVCLYTSENRRRIENLENKIEILENCK